MKNELLLVLATEWEEEANPPEVMCGDESEKVNNAYDRGYRVCKRECADTLRVLIELLKNRKS